MVMSNDLAARRVQDMGTLVCLGVPAGTSLGCDLRSWTIGEDFKGIKLVPEGLRFFHYSSGHGMSQAFFLNFEKGEVKIRRWDPRTEDFSASLDLEQTQIESCIKSVKNLELDNVLGSYSLEEFPRWIKLSCYITEKVLKLCQLGLGVPISAGDIKALDENANEEDLHLTPYFKDTLRTASFTFIPDTIGFTRKRKLKHIDKRPHFADLFRTPDKCTSIAQDSSPLLEALIRVDYNGDQNLLFGEMQLAFVLFMYISSYEALEQWKQIISLVCNCAGFQQMYPEFLITFTSILRTQLEYAPKDLFADELVKDNFLSGSLSRLLHEKKTAQVSKLKNALDQFAQFLKDHFGKSILSLLQSIEDEQDKPVIVETDDIKSQRTDDPEAVGYKLVDAIPQKPDECKRMEWMLPSNEK